MEYKNLITLQRKSGGKESTLGDLYGFDRSWWCFMLEDQQQKAEKVYGETRIPAGIYEIKLRAEGGMHQKYLKKFGKDFHKGMLHLQNVPDFTYIYLHYGNHDDHTLGCPLTGDSQEQNITKRGYVGSSVNAYKRVYKQIVDKLESGEKVFIHVKDEHELW